MPSGTFRKFVAAPNKPAATIANFCLFNYKIQMLPTAIPQNAAEMPKLSGFAGDRIFNVQVAVY